jgi:tetratricopeptide (TPR) repeat protein
VAERAFARDSRHAGAAHAVIHAYDDRERASRALPAARAYATIALTSSHARHMPAHVFVQLGMWDQAAASDEAAWQAAVSHAKARGLTAGQRDYHPLSWLVYEYVQQGRFDLSRSALKPLEDALVADPQPWMKNELATWRAYYIVGSGRWTEVATQHGFDNADELFALGYAAAKTKDMAKARATLDVMKKVAATDVVESRRQLAAIMERQLTAVTSAAAGAMDAALVAARAAAELEDKTPRSTGRPHPVKSSHELYGELLMQAGRPAEAKAQFERALWRVTNRSSSVLGVARAAAAADDAATARKYYDLFLRNWKLADGGRAEVAEARRGAG